ncbi:MAG: LysR family transcriptional regulator [Burkholderiaceae bacterium]|jgi:DNA-binding transcriptional LysR family regulator|nr:LysR family transcriptional regulator [Burkholderiaceae bacterium]
MLQIACNTARVLPLANLLLHVVMLSRKYRYLMALAQERHFGRAAARCHVSPSTLSAAIRDLEATLGVALVERGQSFSGFTSEGLAVLDFARRMAAVEDDLRLHLSQLGEGIRGRLRLGVIPTALTVVAALSAILVKSHPQLSLEILSLNTDDILRRVQSFEIDGGIVYTESSEGPGLEFVPIWHEQHVLIAGRDTAAAQREVITWAEAALLPLCLLTPDMQNRKTINRVFSGLGLQPNPGVETNSIVGMLSHVASGMWCCILPRSVLDVLGTPHCLHVVRLEQPAVSWQTGLVILQREPRPVMAEVLIAAVHRLTGAETGRL